MFGGVDEREGTEEALAVTLLLHVTWLFEAQERRASPREPSADEAFAFSLPLRQRRRRRSRARCETVRVG